ncbi:MAG: hypothetical protein KGD66_00690 [Candidatus Lokiarchaeota archaeon]|nr:hypothetical protein [Candidatus Lokiarchaeota archaeon]
MAKKKITPTEPEEDEVPTGTSDEDGDEVLDLYDEKDNLDEDVIYDLSEIEDDMLADETEDEEFGYEISEVEALMRKAKCDPCAGNSSKRECKVRNDFGCPPDKAKK